MTSAGLLPGELWASVPGTPAHLHLYAVVTSSGFSVLTLRCRRLSRDNKIQKWREGCLLSLDSTGHSEQTTPASPPLKD